MRFSSMIRKQNPSAHVFNASNASRCVTAVAVDVEERARFLPALGSVVDVCERRPVASSSGPVPRPLGIDIGSVRCRYRYRCRRTFHLLPASCNECGKDARAVVSVALGVSLSMCANIALLHPALLSR